MHVPLTGGTGFVGSAVLTALIAAGHEVTAVVRSVDAAANVSAKGATVVIHPLPDTAWLTEQLKSSDGAIHNATPDDGTGPPFDDSVIDAVVAAFAGTDKPYVHTGGIWVYGSAADITESTPINAPVITAWREEREQRILSSGVKASVVAPGIVYGYRKGIPNTISQAPRSDDGALHLVGSGDQHWTTVHVGDLADLFVSVLEKAPGGEIYIGASGQNPTVRELGQAVVGPDGTVEAEELDVTRERLSGPFADALFLDQEATAAKVKAACGWNPHRPSLVEEFGAK